MCVILSNAKDLAWAWKMRIDFGRHVLYRAQMLHFVQDDRNRASIDASPHQRCVRSQSMVSRHMSRV